MSRGGAKGVSSEGSSPAPRGPSAPARWPRFFLVASFTFALTLTVVRRGGDWWRALAEAVGLAPSAEDLEWPDVRSLRLEVDLRVPGRFEATAELAMTGLRGDSFDLLLNRDLRVRRATLSADAGEAERIGIDRGAHAELRSAELVVSHGARPPSDYFREARVLTFELPSDAPRGAVRVRLDYAGEAARGTEGPDWRGILYVGECEARMCEQSAFWPQVPRSLDGPAVRATPFELDVRAPADWELFVPAVGGPRSAEAGRTLEVTAEVAVEVAASADGSPGAAGQIESRAGAARASSEKGRAWHFASARALAPSVLGGVRVRREFDSVGARVTTLMTLEHAGLAEEFERRAREILTVFEARFGPLAESTSTSGAQVPAAPRLGIVEIVCRDSSYNWAADGVIAIDTLALGDEPPLRTLAHELAHLWWGGRASFEGPGERFLTEGLAEACAWAFLEQHGDSKARDAAQWSVRSARQRLSVLVEKGGSTALRAVGFGSPEYSLLAYQKGALVLRCLRGQLGSERFDAALAGLARATRPLAYEDFVAALRAVTGLANLRVPWAEGDGDLEIVIESVDFDAAPALGRSAEGTRADSSAGDARGADRPVGAARRAVDPPAEARGEAVAPTAVAHAIDLTLFARRVPAAATIDPRGTPVRVQFGGLGWHDERTLALTGDRSRLTLDTGGRRASYLHLDPTGTLPRGIDEPVRVASGLRLVESAPPDGARVTLGGCELRLRFDGELEAPDLDALRAAQGAFSSAERCAPRIRSVALDADQRGLVLRTDPWPPGVELVLSLASLRDAHGLPLAARRWHVEVAPSTDRESPRVVRTSPASDARVVAPGGRLRIEVRFDEPMHLGQGITTEGVEEIRSRGWTYPELDGFGVWDEEQRSIRWQLVDLEPGVTYALPIRARGFRDLSGNRCVDHDLVFTVVAR